MIDHGIVSRGVCEPRLLEVLEAVPRHLFVPEGVQGEAYADSALPIGHGATISQPYIVALMTELAVLEPESRVLEIGTGSGYQAAILALLAAEVFTIERVPELAARAERTLSALGISNVTVRVGDGSCGWPEEAPFDAIVVTAAAPRIPEPLRPQLSAGGRLVVPIGDVMTQTLVRLVDTGEGWREERHGGVVFVPLLGRHGWGRGEER